MENLYIYNAFRSVPQTACKEIAAGKLKGFTDINPMWRIKMLTDMFGPCGFGWYIETEDHWSETLGAEIAVFCKVTLRVKHPQTGEWSAPIIGIGGSKLAGKGKGEGLDDEAHKMAFTDAISIACKNLGMAADIYYKNDRTKYNSYIDQDYNPKNLPVMSRVHENWYPLLDSIAAGQATLEQYKKKYYFPEADEAAAKEYLTSKGV
jgi:hypothetical protein